MTQYQVIKHWDVIQAFKDGKTIQVLSGGEWHDLKGDVSFDAHIVYQVKPDPILIPFDYSDAEFLIGKAVKRKNDAAYVQQIVQVGSDRVFIGGGAATYRFLLESCIFLDGSPCGKQKV